MTYIIIILFLYTYLHQKWINLIKSDDIYVTKHFY